MPLQFKINLIDHDRWVSTGYNRSFAWGLVVNDAAQELGFWRVVRYNPNLDTEGVGDLAPAAWAWSRSFSAKTGFTMALTTGLLVLLTQVSRWRWKCTRQRCQPALRTLRAVIFGFDDDSDDQPVTPGPWCISQGPTTTTSTASRPAP